MGLHISRSYYRPEVPLLLTDAPTYQEFDRSCPHLSLLFSPDRMNQRFALTLEKYIIIECVKWTYMHME